MDIDDKRMLLNEYLTFISKSFSEKEKREKCLIAAHYFKCDFDRDVREPKKVCYRCAEDQGLEKKTRRLDHGMYAHEICQSLMEFLVSTEKKANDAIKPMLHFSLQVLHRHSQICAGDQSNSCFEPQTVYYLRPIEFTQKPLIPKEPTSKRLIRKEAVRIPLRVIDIDYRALDPRLRREP